MTTTLGRWRAQSVSAEIGTQTHRMEAEDMALAIVRLKADGFATIMVSTSIRPGFTATLNIYGQRGTIKLSGAEISHWTVPGVEAPSAPKRSAIAVATNLLASNEHHKAQLQDIVQALTSGRDSLVTGEQGTQSVALIEAVYGSAAQGRQIVL